MNRFPSKNSSYEVYAKCRSAEDSRLSGMRVLFPFFCGALFAMVLCALVAVRGPLRSIFVVLQASADDALRVPAAEAPVQHAAEQEEKTVLEYYRDPLTRSGVINYFAALCESREVASVILIHAESLDVPAALAFSLCWEESRYKPWAVNRTNRDGSVDRGLFQLNSRSFPGIEEKDFYNPVINAYYGMQHLRWCLDSGGSVITALAMYNAGAGRVHSLGAPKNTLDYIHRILERQETIEAQFRREFLPAAGLAAGREAGGPEGHSAEIAGRPERPRFISLMPLAGIR